MTFDETVAELMEALRKADYDAAGALLDRAEAASSSEAERALMQIRRASIPVLQGRRDAEWNVFRENIIRRHSAKHVQLASYYIVANAIDRHDLASADRYLPMMLETAHEAGDPHMTACAHDAAASVESMRGNHVAAIEYGRAALAEAEQYEGPDAVLLRANIAHNIAYNCLVANEFGDAVQSADVALSYMEQGQNDELLRQILITAAFAYLLRDRLDEAEAFVIRAEPLARGSRLEQYVHYVRGEAARRRGDEHAAKKHLQKLGALYPGVPNVAEMLLSMNFAPFLVPE